jgi:hypothetical protein
MSQAGIISVLRDALATALTMAAPFLAPAGHRIIVSDSRRPPRSRAERPGLCSRSLPSRCEVGLVSWLIAHGVDLFTPTFARFDTLS